MVKFNKPKIRAILLKQSLFSLGVLTLIRGGTFLPIPGINHTDVGLYIQNDSTIKNLISTFSGDQTFVISVFTLSIFPHINATILTQLLVGFVPQLSRLQKEGDLTDKRIIARLTRLIGLIFGIVQSVSISLYLKQILFDWNILLGFEIVIWLTTGTMIVLWLSELITDYGLGNGASLLIYTNIISNLPNLYKKVLAYNYNIGGNVMSSSLGIFLLILISLYGIVFLQAGTLRIRLISSRQLNQLRKRRRRTDDRYYLPIRFNQSGVMPIVLTTTVLVIPNYIFNSGLLPELSFFESFKFLYWVVYFALILVSSSFYSSVVLNPKDLSKQLQKMAVTIPGIRPGIRTTFFLERRIKRINLIGATILAIITIVPNFLESSLKITGLNGLSTTSLLLLVGVILDVIREIDDICYSNTNNSA